MVWRAPVLSILKSSVPAALLKERNLPLKPVVEEAEIKLPVVEVALTWNKELVLSEAVVVAPMATDLVEVAERKLVEKISQPWPKVPASEPSQRSDEPVMAVQKAAKVVPVVPKILKIPPPIAKLVVEAVVV